jgi:hypothetical protein
MAPLMRGFKDIAAYWMTGCLTAYSVSRKLIRR